MSLDAELEGFVSLVLTLPDADDEKLADSLRSRGTPRSLAARLIAFVPMAFEHAMLESDGATIPTHYLVDSGRRRRALLATEPVYRAAWEYARRLGVRVPNITAIADRSAEAACVRDLLPAGGSARGLHFTEPVLLRLSAEDVQTNRPWWAIWERVVRLTNDWSGR